jgi:1,4-alpha-glucan branching enzyme
MNTNKQSKEAFHFVAPESARKVVLVGDFTQWQQNGIPMHRDDNGVWTASVALSPGTHRYRFIVDGQWWDDPACKSRAPNPFGSEDMLRNAA